MANSLISPINKYNEDKKLSVNLTIAYRCNLPNLALSVYVEASILCVHRLYQRRFLASARKFQIISSGAELNEALS